jgi:hypothetical protein
MSLEQIQQNYADATGYVMDRTTSPPKILGQAFLVSKSRAVTCASVVYNYIEAPWALQVNFVHPDILLGVKSLALHNDFDKRLARTWYLSQTGNPGEQLVLPNDMASLVLDAQLVEMTTDKVGELNRALTIPFSNEGVDASGSIQGGDLVPILSGVLQSQRTGLITLFDPRNTPIARIAIAQGKILKVYYRGLLGELAFFELLYRRPAQGYAFQGQSNFSWGNVRDIIAPSEALIEEAMRRAQELPQLLAYLGGPDARYQKRIETIEASQVSENIQWLIERLWEGLDGFMTIDRLSERVGADTYTVATAMRELVNKAVVSMLNKATPFHCNGSLGQPLTSHTDFEVHAWDPLQAFYLDPISGKPTWMQGNFFGVANALQPKNMLHTIGLPVGVPGALVLKDYKLIGVHGGPHMPKPGQPAPPVKLYQMMWMGALLDMSTKKLRAQEDGQAAGGFTKLRSSEEEEEATAGGPPVALDKFVCSNCHMTNTKVGPCFNCGTMVVAPEPEPEPDTKLGKLAAHATAHPLGKKYVDFKAQHNLSNKQVAIWAGAFVCLPLLLISMCQPAPPPAVAPVAQTGGPPGDANPKSSAHAVQMAAEYAGFSGTAIPGYWFVDTSEQTKPAKSFGMESDQGNNKVWFLIMDDMAAVENLANFRNKPPFQDDVLPNESRTKYDEHQSLLGSEKLATSVGDYGRKEDAQIREKILVGAFPSPQAGKSILVISRAKDPAKPYDPRATEFLIDQMEIVLKDRATKMSGNSSVQAGKPHDDTDEKAAPVKEEPIASDEDLDKYCKTIAEQVQAKLKLPDDALDEIKKEHFKKLKCSLTVGIDGEGKVTKLELNKVSELDSAVGALQHAVNACSPFEGVPHTKSGNLEVMVKYDGKKIKVERL